jgi:hypothetical protein
MTMAEDNQSAPDARPTEAGASDSIPGPASTSGPAPGGASAPGGSPAPGGAPKPEGSPAPKGESLIDAIADLMQMCVDWFRSEAADVMRDKVVLPMQQLGLTVASASAAGCLVVIGLMFIFVAVLLILAQWLGWPGALLLVGGLILAGAGVFTYIKMRSIQK